MKDFSIHVKCFANKSKYVIIVSLNGLLCDYTASYNLIAVWTTNVLLHVN